jgi:hypothetical protein
VDEVGIRLFRPAPRSLVELVGEHTHRDRDISDALDAEERELVLGVETTPGDRCVPSFLLSLLHEAWSSR